jgi:hypothetical protein
MPCWASPVAALVVALALLSLAICYLGGSFS